MMTSKTLIILGFSLLATILAVHVAEGEEDNQFESEIRYMNDRYEDFFKHEETLRRHRAGIDGGIPAVKKARQAEADRYEAARLEQIRNRVPSVDSAEAEAIWLAEQELYRQEQEKGRRAHILRREQLRKIRESARKIPEEKELGL